MDVLTQSLSVTVGALAAWRLGAGPFARPLRPKYSWPEADESLHRIVTRVVGSEDIEYLRAQSPDLAPYLRSSRKAFLRTYLRETKVSFQESSLLVRQFAADTDAPDLAFTALRQSVRFHALWLVLRTSLALNLAGPVWRMTEKLLGAIDARGQRQVPDQAQAARF